MSESQFVELRFPAKDPAAVLDYRIEFDDLIASLPTGVDLIGCVWSVVPLVGDLTPLAVK